MKSLTNILKNISYMKKKQRKTRAIPKSSRCPSTGKDNRPQVFDHLWMAACNSVIWLDKVGTLLVQQVVPTVVDDGRDASRQKEQPVVASALLGGDVHQRRSQKPDVN